MEKEKSLHTQSKGIITGGETSFVQPNCEIIDKDTPHVEHTNAVARHNGLHDGVPEQIQAPAHVAENLSEEINAQGRQEAADNPIEGINNQSCISKCSRKQSKYIYSMTINIMDFTMCYITLPMYLIL